MLRLGKYGGPTWYPMKYVFDFHIPKELVTDGWWQMKKYVSFVSCTLVWVYFLSFGLLVVHRVTSFFLRFLIRREPGGPIMYRTEPMHVQDWFVIPPESFTSEDWSEHGPMVAFDCLYNHFQAEKFSGASPRLSFLFVKCIADHAIIIMIRPTLHLTPHNTLGKT